MAKIPHSAFRLLLALPPALLADPGSTDLPPLPGGNRPELEDVIRADVPAVDNQDRSAVEAFCRRYFSNDDIPDMRWSGSDDDGRPGTIDPAFQRAVLRRINAYRAFACLPGDVLLLRAWSRKTQQAAFMTSQRDWIGHLVSWRIPFYTEGAGEAAAHSAIILGETGPRAVDRFIEDPGGHNYGVGHRRWLLLPSNQFMGVGAVPFRGGDLRESLVVWVVGGEAPMPQRRSDQPVLWPTPGYFPLRLLPERWSLSLPKADFSEAQISATLNGAALPATREPLVDNLAENTIVWRFDTLAATGYAEGMAFRVTVTGIRLPESQPIRYTYETRLIHPEF